ncbi:PAS domain-containing protein [Blastopirellula sp. JC732]|uniref:histidine kinase n=1 Tax=Blastopirellula sediminis TaxID=2894196 RepID=A0A9X1MMW9_9BACT|nr:PAS domain-containing protein [Blastopirellula sediminis]
MRRSDTIVRTTIQQLGDQSGFPYLQTLVNSLGAGIGCKLSMVGRMLRHDATKVRISAHWERGEREIPDNLIYGLKDTPCEQIARNCLAIFPHALQEQFPKDLMLQELGYVSYAGAPLTDSQGKVIGLIALLDDKPMQEEEMIASLLTLFASGAGKELERQSAESELEENERRLQMLVDLSSDVVWDWDIVTDRLSLSDRLYEILGYGPGAFASTRDAIHTLMHPEDLANHGVWLREYLANGQGSYSHEWRLLANDGRYKWFRSSGTIIRTSQGEPIRMIGVITDVSDAKAAEEERERLISELEQKNAELERFTYTVSHELRSPLVTLSGFVGVLEEDIQAGDADAVAADCHEIMLAVRKMGTLLDNLLELSRLDRVSHPHEDVPLLELVDESLSLLQSRIESAGIEIAINGNLPIIGGDRVRWQQVIQNLLENAVKYRSPENPRIEIGAITDKDRPPTIYVQDNGIGIEPKFQQRVFGLFEKLDPRSEGTGVGLALVQRIVQLQGGRIWLDSLGKGYGSTFYIELPVVDETPVEAE